MGGEAWVWWSADGEGAGPPAGALDRTAFPSAGTLDREGGQGALLAEAHKSVGRLTVQS